MKDIDTILADYQNADSNKRLNLYLSFPNLRKVFFLLDQTHQSEGTARPKQKKERDLKKLDLMPCASILAYMDTRRLD